MTCIVRSTRTDAEGRYRLANLPAGKYDVWAEEPAGDWSKFERVLRGVTDVQALAAGVRWRRRPCDRSGWLDTRGNSSMRRRGSRWRLARRGGLRASFFLGEPQSHQNLPLQRVSVSPGGKFELRTVPGELRVFLIVDLQQVGSQPQGDFRSDDDVWRTGRLFDLRHGESAEAEFRVWPYARIEKLLRYGRERI